MFIVLGKEFILQSSMLMKGKYARLPVHQENILANFNCSWGKEMSLDFL